MTMIRLVKTIMIALFFFPVVVVSPYESQSAEVPMVILKLDDFRPGYKLLTPRWQRVVDFLAERKLKASFGIIGEHLETAKEPFCDWVRSAHESGMIEFWNHGYTHVKTIVENKEVYEFNTSYWKQKRSLLKTQRLAEEKLGFPITTFGASYNIFNVTTARVLEENPDIQIWLYGTKAVADEGEYTKTVLVRNINMEKPTSEPNFKNFRDRYEKGNLGDCIVLQGHPNNWRRERNFKKFEKIINYLQDKGSIFVTPREYAAMTAMTGN